MIYPDLSSFLTCYLPLIKQLTLVHDSLFVTEALSRNNKELTRAQADCDNWHRLRKNNLTASKFKLKCARRANFEKLATDLLKHCNI